MIASSPTANLPGYLLSDIASTSDGALTKWQEVLP
jgi:hypothetical protein